MIRFELGAQRTPPRGYRTPQRKPERRAPRRREFLRTAAVGAVGTMVYGWAVNTSGHAEDGDSQTRTETGGDSWRKGRARSCILVWLGGGPSQLETWDPKPGHPNGGPTKAIHTKADFQIADHFPRLAQEANDFCLLRTLNSREGEHGRASYLLHTGYRRVGALSHPSLGSILAKELGREDAELPHFVSVGGGTYGPGFLGVRYRAFHIDDPKKPVPFTKAPREVDGERFRNRLSLLDTLDGGFLDDKAGAYLAGHQTLRAKALALLESPQAKVFAVDKEPASVREPFGKNSFGLSALLAARLVEKGVPAVEIHLGGWDTHTGNFDAVRNRAAVLDPALSTLIRTLRERGLLETTLVVCMGEFGRTPQINRNSGRDHYPRCFSALLAGGGIRGGCVVGESTKGGEEVKERPISVPDLYATVLSALGIDPLKENRSSIGRSIKLSDAGRVLAEVLL